MSPAGKLPQALAAEGHVGEVLLQSRATFRRCGLIESSTGDKRARILTSVCAESVAVPLGERSREETPWSRRRHVLPKRAIAASCAASSPELRLPPHTRRIPHDPVRPLVQGKLFPIGQADTFPPSSSGCFSDSPLRDGYHVRRAPMEFRDLPCDVTVFGASGGTYRLLPCEANGLHFCTSQSTRLSLLLLTLLLLLAKFPLHLGRRDVELVRDVEHARRDLHGL